ncbi:hypothetical protein EIP91_007386 [Steccherinum ochraceum]|uniref:Uncharacterized protein n=1 Tax=Steccherinum ochraceum TaxID=92696 RepID=A0A4R0RZ28_9APHY|nr:hypothetical protein EIP91_007386 [Steccherinum ochraceum]
MPRSSRSRPAADYQAAWADRSVPEAAEHSQPHPQLYPPGPFDFDASSIAPWNELPYPCDYSFSYPPAMHTDWTPIPAPNVAPYRAPNTPVTWDPQTTAQYWYPSTPESSSNVEPASPESPTSIGRPFRKRWHEHTTGLIKKASAHDDDPEMQEQFVLVYAVRFVDSREYDFVAADIRTRLDTLGRVNTKPRLYASGPCQEAFRDCGYGSVEEFLHQVTLAHSHRHSSGQTRQKN